MSSKTLFDTYWEQTKRKFGGFSSLNLKDEANLKSLIKSAITEDAPVGGAEIDYERLGAVMYCAVRAALEQVLPDKLQTYAVQSAAPIQAFHKVTENWTQTEATSLPGAFFTGGGDTNLGDIKTDASESTGVSDSLDALRKMKQGDS